MDTPISTNPWISETNVTVKAATQVPATSLAEANETLYTSLTYGIALEQDRGGGRKSHTVKFLDFEKPARNEWVVTRQYTVLGSKKHVIPDVVAFVNGLPLAVLECKSPTIGDTWKAEAVTQLRRYQEADTRWKDQAAQMLIGTCGERAVYGTVGTPERFFLEWKEPYPLSVKQFGEQIGRTPTPPAALADVRRVVRSADCRAGGRGRPALSRTCRRVSMRASPLRGRILTLGVARPCRLSCLGSSSATRSGSIRALL